MGVHFGPPVSTVIENLSRPARGQHHRFGLLFWYLAITLVLLAGRSFWLQVMHGEEFLARAEGNRVAEFVIPAPRGIIFDRHSEQLVENVASTDVILDPLYLSAEEDEASLLDTLPPLIPIEPARLAEALRTARTTQKPARLSAALDHESVLRVEEHLEELPGVRLASTSVRKYLTGYPLAHVLGYTGSVTADELTKRPSLLPTDSLGKAGIEKQFDVDLRGMHGAAYAEVNASGRPQKDLGKRAPHPGNSLYLTIDNQLQEFIYGLLSERDSRRNEQPGLRGAAVIVQDTNTGALVALVNYPSFDPNIFSQPALRGPVEDIFNDPLQPLFNRAVDGTYAPGSTIKPMLAAAALDAGVITPATTVQSTGGISIGEWHFPDWKPGGHGQTEVTKAIAESVNTFFYLATGGDGTTPGLGINRAAEYLQRFGWGAKTGIDLPSEAAGFIPTPRWKEQTKHERWYIGDTYHLGIGQGDVLVTPLQLSAAIAAVANGGRFCQPFTVASIRSEERTIFENVGNCRTISVSPRHLETVRRGMRRTVEEGSGRRLAALPVAVAGKTGTAQIGGSNDTHAWFTSFGPYEAPRLAVTVLLERGGAGDRDAVPVAQEIWQWLSEHAAE